MTATIRLTVDNRSGVLAAVASELQSAGIRVKSHDIETLGDTSAQLTLETEAAGEVDVADIRDRLNAISAVQNVDEVRAQDTPKSATGQKEKAPAELVERIAEAYPKIMPHIQNYEERIARDPEKNDKLRRLGKAVGARFVAESGSEAPETKTEVVDAVVLPRIGSIAEASRENDSIVVPISLFTRRMVTSMDLFSGEDENCWFLCGFIEGLIGAHAGYDTVTVEETKCRANGDSACVFTLG